MKNILMVVGLMASVSAHAGQYCASWANDAAVALSKVNGGSRSVTLNDDADADKSNTFHVHLGKAKQEVIYDVVAIPQDGNCLVTSVSKHTAPTAMTPKAKTITVTDVAARVINGMIQDLKSSNSSTIDSDAALATPLYIGTIYTVQCDKNASTTCTVHDNLE